jgi:NADH-quinone oxidoreductase subunit L
MTVPLLVLGLLALVGGFTLSTFSGVGGRIQEFLQPVLGRAPEAGSASLSAFWLSVIATVLAFAGAGVAWYLYGSGQVQWLALRERFAAGWRVLSHKLYVDELYEFFTVRLGSGLVAFLAGPVDRSLIDGAVNDLAGAVGGAASRGRRLQTGLVRTYAVGVLGGAVLLLAFLIFRRTS